MNHLNDLVKKIQPYAKTAVAVGGIVVLVGRAALDGAISSEELNEILLACGIGFGVYRVPNKPQA